MTISVNWQQDSTYPAATDRLLIAGAMFKNGAASPRAGCLRPDDLEVTAAGGSMDLTVAAGQVMIDGYLVTVDDDVTVTPDVGGATDRTDLIIARVYDEESGDDTSEGAIEVVKGTSTTEPDLPDRSIKLATVAVDASVSTLASGDLTDKRVFTTGAGGALWLPGGLAAAVPSGLDDGAVIWDSQAGQIGVNAGGSWKSFVDKDTLIGPYTTSGICTAGTGWTVNTQIGQRMGPFMYIVTACTYSGSTITATSKGVVSGSNIMFTLTTAWNNKNIGRFPGFTCQGNFAASYPYAAWAAQAKSNGDVVIVSGAPTFTIVSGDVIVTTGMYLAAA